MRLYSHYAFGETVNIFLQESPGAKPEDMKQGFLIEDKDWTTTYFDLDDKAHGAPLIFRTCVPPTARPGDSEIAIGFKAPPPAVAGFREPNPQAVSAMGRFPSVTHVRHPSPGQSGPRPAYGGAVLTSLRLTSYSVSRFLST